MSPVHQSPQPFLCVPLCGDLRAFAALGNLPGTPVFAALGNLPQEAHGEKSLPQVTWQLVIWPSKESSSSTPQISHPHKARGGHSRNLLVLLLGSSSSDVQSVSTSTKGVAAGLRLPRDNLQSSSAPYP